MATNPYDAAASDLFSGQLALGARASVTSVADRNPDAEAQTQAKAAQLGVPYESARAHPQIIGPQVAGQAVDYNNLARQAPKTAQFLSSTSNAAIAHDDVGVLGTLEKGLRLFGYLANPANLASDLGFSAGRGVAATVQQDVKQQGGTRPFLSALGKSVSPENIGRHVARGVAELGSDVLGSVQGTESLAEKVDVTAGLQRRLFGGTMESGLAGLSASARRKVNDYISSVKVNDPTQTGAAIGQGIESLPAMGAATGATLAGGPLAGAAAFGALGYGGSYGRAVDEDVGDGRAQAKAAIDGLVNAAAAFVPETAFAGDVAGGAGAGKFIADQFLTQIPAMQAMTLAQDFNQWAMIDANRGKTFDQYVQEIAPHAYASLIASGIGAVALGGLGGAMRAVGHAGGAHAEDEARAQQAQAVTQQVEDLGKLSAASALRERAPSAFHELVDHMADGSPAENVYVPPDKLYDALYQDDGTLKPDMEAADNALGPKIKDALEQGTDVQVPASDFATYIAGTPAEKALLDHLKVDPHGMTRAEAEDFMTTKGDALKAEIDQQLQKSQADTVHASELDQVRSKILDQLAQANRFTQKVNERYADLQAAFYGTLAKRLNESPNTLYERYPIRIVNRAMPDSQFEQPAYLQLAREPSLRAAVKVDGKVYAAPNNDHFAALDQVPDRQRVAATLDGANRGFVSEGGKFLNRREAAAYANQHKLIAPTAPAYAHTAPELIGEHLAEPRIPTSDVTPEQFWHAVDNGGELHQSADSPIFYSELEKAVEGSSQAKASPEQWLATLSKTPGVKKEEIEWTELPEWLATQDGPVTREELLTFVRAGGVQVEEVDKSGPTPQNGYNAFEYNYTVEPSENEEGRFDVMDDDGVVLSTWDSEGDAHREIELLDEADAGGDTQFESYTEDGGEDYHELLLTLPPGVGGNPERAPSTHFDEPGVVAHLRFKTRSTTDGKKLLFIEEVQSDWHQKGRDQGYAQPLSEEERDAAHRTRAEALDTYEQASKNFTAAFRAKVEAELKKHPDVAEPPTPEVQGESAKIYREQIVGDALRGDRTSIIALGATVRFLREQNDPELQALADYAEALAKGADRDMLKRTLNDLQTESAHDFILGLAYSPFGYTNSANVAFDQKMREAEDAWKDAKLKLNEAEQAFNNARGDNGIPDAPFKATWPALAMKRAIRWAADNGFEAVAWTTGDQQRERYNLGEALNGATIKKDKDGYIVVVPHGVSNAIAERGLAERMAGTSTLKMQPEQIGEVFGKDLGSRMMALADQAPIDKTYGVRQAATVEGLDMRIGGEGMNAFYDRNLVNITNNILKKLGGSKVEMLPVGGMGETSQVNALRVQYESVRDGRFGGSESMATVERDLEHAKEMADRYNSEGVGADQHRFWSNIVRTLEGATEETFAPLREAEQRLRDAQAQGTNPGFTITPEIAQHAREGFALFQKNRGAYSPATNTISLLEHADLSTFMHESGHFFLDTYERIVGTGNAPQQIQDDFGAFLKWAGVKDAQTWAGMSLEEKRAAHEKFARGFEAYLFTGRAPAPKLRELFRTFRSWLIAVYKHARTLGVRPTEQIRQVMDRMLGSDEEIADAQAARSMEPLFKDQASSGMSEDQWQDYQRTNATATQEAEAQLSTRSLRDLKWFDAARSKEINRLKRQADAVRKSTRARVAAEVAQEPVYRAQQFFKRGALDGEQSEGPHKLSIESVDKLLGSRADAADIKRKLGYGKYGVLAENGIDAEAAAQAFGFTSADHLVTSLATAEPPADKISGVTEQRLLEEHGDLTDPQSIDEAASEAVHNEFRARAVAAELAALAKAAGKPRLLAQAARQFAEDTVARTRIRDLKPAKYEAAASRAAKAAMKALGEGNLQQAALEKRNQLFNLYATKGAQKARDEVDKALALFDRLTRPATAKSIESSYRDQIVQLLDRYDLNRGTPLKAIDERISLAGWVERQREQGFDPAVPDEIIADAGRHSYKQLTVEELRGLVDSVKSIEHLGRLKSKLLTAKKDRDFQTAVEKIAGRITGESYKTIKQPLKPTRAQKIKASVGEFFADLRKLSSFARELDGFTDGGPVWEHFIRPLNDAADKEATMRSDASRNITDLLKPIEGLKDKLFIPAINNSLDLEARLAIALNTGNEINRERVLAGEGWNDGQLQAVLQTLDSSHWSTVQKIWDLIGSYWPEIAAKERRVTGVEPERVEGDPLQVVTADGQTLQLPGGYYPIKYNANRSTRADGHESAEIARAMMQGAYTRATTRRGHTKARVNSTGMALRYDLNVIPEHVAQVIHDVTHHEALIDVTRLLRASAVDSAIRDHYGPTVLRTFRKTFEDVAGGDIASSTAFDRTINYLRSGGIAANLGFNIYVSLLHPFNIVKAARAIGPKWVTKATLRFMADAATMNSTAKRISEMSPFMASRTRTMFRELDEARNTINGKSTARSTIDHALFYLIERGQLLADIPTWLAQYDKSLDAGEEHDRAVALADQAVLRIQGGGGVKDRPDIMRGGSIKKLFTAFYSFTNSNYNLFAESVNQTKKEGVAYTPMLAADTLIYVMFPAVLHMGLRSLLNEQLPDGKDVVASLVNGFFALFPISRDFGPLIAGTSKDATPAGLPYEPIARLITDLHRKDLKLDERMVRDINMTAGTVFHYPAAQVDRTARGIMALANGDTHNPAALILGPPPTPRKQAHY